MKGEKRVVPQVSNTEGTKEKQGKREKKAKKIRGIESVLIS